MRYFPSRPSSSPACEGDRKSVRLVSGSAFGGAIPSVASRRDDGATVGAWLSPGAGGDSRQLRLSAAGTFDLLASQVFLDRERLLALGAGERKHGGSLGRMVRRCRRQGFQLLYQALDRRTGSKGVVAGRITQDAGQCFLGPKERFEHIQTGTAFQNVLFQVFHVLLPKTAQEQALQVGGGRTDGNRHGGFLPFTSPERERRVFAEPVARAPGW